GRRVGVWTSGPGAEHSSWCLWLTEDPSLERLGREIGPRELEGAEDIQGRCVGHGVVLLGWFLVGPGHLEGLVGLRLGLGWEFGPLRGDGMGPLVLGRLTRSWVAP